MKFAFCDRGDWRVQIYLPLMKDLAERGHDVIIFTPGWTGKWAARPRPYFSKLASRWGVKISTQKVAIKQGYTLVTDQDFLRRTGSGKKFIKCSGNTVPWTSTALRRIYAAGKIPFSKPVVVFGYFTTGTGVALSFAYPPGSVFIGDYAVDYKQGDYYFKNWSFAKHAVSRISKKEARRVLGLPPDRKVFSALYEPRCKKGQIKAVVSIASKYKKMGYFTVFKTKGQKVRPKGVDLCVRDMVTNRPMPPMVELCKASDVMYSYVYHGPSNLIRSSGVPYILEAGLDHIVGRVPWWEAHMVKSILPIGFLLPHEPLGAFKSRSLADKFNHTCAQFVEKVTEWQKQTG